MPDNIVIDTNVLVAALRSRNGASFRLLSTIDDGKSLLHLSTPLVMEYEEVLKRKVEALTAEEVDDVIDYLCSIARHHRIFYLWRPVLRDPDDDFLLELAVKAGAAIITHNKKDFAKAGSFGIAVYTPGEYLAAKGVKP